jgi:hypothetical protein
MRLLDLSRKLSDGARAVDAIAVGDTAARGIRPPDRYVYLGREALRIDVFSFLPDAFCFEAAIHWLDWIAIGVGSHVHLVSLIDRSSRSLGLGSYFGSLNPTADYLLIASGERVRRLEPNGKLLWTSDVVGVDGVVLRVLGPPKILGDGEWDPPGGWRPFALDTLTGRTVAFDAG